MNLILSMLASLVISSTDIGIDNSFKAYMDYRTITDTNSLQYQLQEEAWTDENGFRRYDDRYMIALGSFYTGDTCGRLFKVILDDGTIIDCITGDVKADIHTDDTNRFCHVNNELGCIVEFIVDTNNLLDEIKISGDCDKFFAGQIIGIFEE